MIDSTSKTLTNLHRQLALGKNFADTSSPRMAAHHYRKVVDLYNSLPNDAKKTVEELYEDCLIYLFTWEKIEEAKVPKTERVVKLADHKPNKKKVVSDG